MTLRKVTKNRGSFPTQDAAIKLLYLALQKVFQKMADCAGLARGAAAICDPLAGAHRAGAGRVAEKTFCRRQTERSARLPVERSN